MFYMGAASVGTVIDIAIGVQIIIGAVLGGRRTILGAALGAIVLMCATKCCGRSANSTRSSSPRSLSR